MLSRDVLNKLLPEGSFWTPAEDDDYDKLLEGIADNSEYMRLAMKELRYLRDPAQTSILSDLEKEYAQIPTVGDTEADRRMKLAVKMFGRNTVPTYELLEAKLRDAGFDVYVYANSPAVDPNLFLTESFNMTCGDLLPGGNDAQCGEPEAICAQIGGQLLVNGDVYIQLPGYIALAGEAWVQCGEAGVQAGQIANINKELVLYSIPVDGGYWPLIFFVSGLATRDPITGELTDIEIASIPTERESEFKKIILQYKPMASWAGLVCVFQ